MVVEEDRVGVDVGFGGRGWEEDSDAAAGGGTGRTAHIEFRVRNSVEYVV